MLSTFFPHKTTHFVAIVNLYRTKYVANSSVTLSVMKVHHGDGEAFRVLECILAQQHISYIFLLIRKSTQKECNHIAWMLSLLLLLSHSFRLLTRSLVAFFSSIFLTFESNFTCSNAIANSGAVHICCCNFRRSQRQCHHKHSLVYVIIITSWRATAKNEPLWRGKKANDNTIFFPLPF